MNEKRQQPSEPPTDAGAPPGPAASIHGTTTPPGVPGDGADQYVGILKEWRSVAERAKDEHAVSGWRSGFWNTILGVPAVLFSAIVGSSVFATLSSDVYSINVSWRVIIASLSLLAAGLTSLQTFFGFTGNAMMHQKYWAEYECYLRHVDTLILDIQTDGVNAKTNKRILELEEELDRIDRGAPVVSTWVVRKFNRDPTARRRKRRAHNDVRK